MSDPEIFPHGEPPAAVPPAKCINCDTAGDGGYETYDGNVGPFCSTCFGYLNDYFVGNGYFDEDSQTHVRRHLVISAGKTPEEADAALASAVKLTAETWPNRHPVAPAAALSPTCAKCGEDVSMFHACFPKLRDDEASEPDESKQCGARQSPDGWALECTRTAGHQKGLHIAHGTAGEVIGAWTWTIPAFPKSAALSPTFPIPLNEKQEAVVKLWALPTTPGMWGSPETVEFNLRTFARKILAEAAALSPSEEPDDSMTWERAALIFGEQLASVGPVGYYQFTPRQWLTWARAASAHLSPRRRTEY